MLRLDDVLKLGEEIFTMTPSELVARNVCSPIRLFIKDEPHKLKKIESGKLRLISGVGIDDQIIDRMVYSVQNNSEIDEWSTIPSKPGIGLDDTGLRLMTSTFTRMFESSRSDGRSGRLQSTDISGWDWSVQGWEIELDAEVRRRLADAPRGSLFDFLTRYRAYCISHKVFCLPDGTLVAQTGSGIQASGWYCTSSTNSRMRVAARLAAMLMSSAYKYTHKEDELMNVVAMGDDAVEEQLDGAAQEQYEILGHCIKDVSVADAVEDLEFCSHRWLRSGLACPTTAVKTLFRYFSHPIDSTNYLDWYSQLRNDLRNLPESDHIFEAARTHAEWAKDNGTKARTAAAPPSGACQQ